MIEQLIKYWKKGEVSLNKGASLEEIHALERHLDFEFPEDFIAFYQEIDGFKDNDTTPNMFELYPLERIKEEFWKMEGLLFVPVGDFLIASHFFCYIKGKMGIYKDYDHEERVCYNLTELLIMVDNDAEELY